MNNTYITRLNNIVNELYDQACTIDQFNDNKQVKLMPWQEQLFSANLFRQESNHYCPFVTETRARIISLANALQHDKAELAELLLTQIEQQISALTIALNANDALHHEAKYQKSATKRRYKRQQQIKSNELNNALVANKNLYQMLAEHHEFERRLKNMLMEAEMLRNAGAAKNSERLTQQVLTLHQRLGRCRKAISAIEIDIERAEKRQ